MRNVHKNNLNNEQHVKCRDFMHKMLFQMKEQASNRQNEENNAAHIEKHPQQATTVIPSLQSNQALQASALVGRKVLIKSNVLSLGIEKSAQVMIDLIAGMTNVAASIYSSCGKLIKKIYIHHTEPGPYSLWWDGTDDENHTMESGFYTIHVRGFSSGQEEKLSTSLWVNIDSVSIGHQGYGLRLNLAGLGAISLDEIQDISV